MKRGFTLIEIMIVVAVIVIISAIAIPAFAKYQEVSRQKVCYANMQMLNRATEAYIINMNLPNDTEVTLAMIAPDAASELKNNYFIRYKPVCPFDGTYTYIPAEHSWSCSHCGIEQ